MLGYCSDTCNLMFGERHSVYTLLEEAIADFEALKCGDHIAHLSARNGARVLPHIFEQICHLTYDYIYSSSKRVHKWMNLQEKKFVEKLKIRKPNFIRWLSYYQCMERIYQRWSLLVIYFQGELEEDTSKGQYDNIMTILNYLISSPNKLYHLFILSIYKKINITNLVLQSEKPVVSLVNVPLQRLYLDFIKMYMNAEYVIKTPVEKINPNSDTYWKPLQCLELNEDVIKKFNAISNEINQKEFFEDCRSVLRELCCKLKQRYKMDQVYSLNEFTYQKNALSKKFHE